MTTIDAILARPKPNAAAMRDRIAEIAKHVSVAGDPPDPAALLALLRVLYRVGRSDLPLGRLLEGHCDASQIVARYGDRRLPEGAVTGVWNAALPGEPLRVTDGRLHGGKAFASGAGILSHALAGADTADGNRLVLVDLDESGPDIDRSWWRTIGMQRSETHIVRWHGTPAFRFVGEPGDYAREPWFSGGALRFVAVHAGGVAALFDHVRDHLVAVSRAADPHQASRLAQLYTLAAGAAAAVRDAAGSWGDDAYVQQVAAARLAVADAAERALALAQAAVGVQGMFDDHPLSAVLADLSVYLRQPVPDVQAMRVGAAAAAGILVPQL